MEILIAEKLDDVALLEEKLILEKKFLEKSALRVQGKLTKLCEALEKLKETLSTKDG